MEGDLWAFLVKGLPFNKPISLDYETVLLFKTALFFHSFMCGGLTDIKDYCLTSPFYSGQPFHYFWRPEWLP